MADKSPAYDFSNQAPKKSLSGNLMQMKFMQRRQEADEQRKKEDKIKREIEASHWTTDSDGNQLQTVIMEPSFVICEELMTIGRMSFNGFNPDIEKLHANILMGDELLRAEEREEEDGISDSELAARMENLSETIGKKFAKKRRRPKSTDDEPSSPVSLEHERTKKKAKAVFMKPKVD